MEEPWVRSSGRACSPTSPPSCCPRRTGCELNEGKEITLVTGLRQLRKDVFDVRRLRHRRRPRLALGDHRRVRRHRPAAPRRPVHLRGAAARHVPDAVRLPRRPRTRPQHRAVRRQARHLDHRDRGRLPADLLRHHQPVEVPRRGAARQAVGDHRGLPDRRHGGPPAARPRARRRHRRDPGPQGAAHRLRRAVAHLLAAARAARPRGQRPRAHLHAGGPRGRLRAHRLVQGGPPRQGPRHHAGVLEVQARGEVLPLPDDGRRPRRGRLHRQGPPVRRVRELHRHRPGAPLVRPPGRRLDRHRHRPRRPGLRHDPHHAATRSRPES